MQKVNQLIENLRANENIASKLFAIETKILNCTNTADLFQTLFYSIQEKFNISGVYLNINASMLAEIFPENLILEPVFLKDARINIVTPKELQNSLEDDSQIKLTNEIHEMVGVLQQDLLENYNSLANIPLHHSGQLFATLVLADESSERYHKGLGSYYLEQLSVRLSLAIQNIIVREKLEFMATHDPLTGLKNRRCLEQTMKAEISRYQRYNTPFSLMFIDCNKFKLINDTHGHACGDKVLQYIASNLLELSRDSDEVFRFAGDEFVVALANQNIEQAHAAVNRFMDHFQSLSLIYNGKKIYPTISCGVAQCTQGEQMDSLIKRADTALYAAKLNTYL